MSFKFSALSTNAGDGVDNTVIDGPGFEVAIIAEKFNKETEWSIMCDRVSLILHLGGEIDKIESEFDGRGLRLDPPLPGEVWIVPSGIKYSTHVKGSSAKYVELVFDTDVFGRAENGSPLRPMAGGYDHFLLRKVGEIDRLRKMSDDITEIRLFEAVSEIVQHLNTFHAAAPEPKTKRAIFFRQIEKVKIDNYIQDNLSEPLSLAGLCELVNETPHRFLWAFRHAFFSTPAQFILDQRIRRARRELQTTSKDITTVAMETGFANHSHLTTAFRQRTGITPTQFRKLF